MYDSFVIEDGTEFYKISGFDKIKPFLFTLASAGDIWIYLSTNGGVTAGRRTSDNALFPYVPEDVLHHSTDTGAKTLIRARFAEKSYLWQPFDISPIRRFETERNIYKSVLGNSVIFEEKNITLSLTFRCRWQISDKYGIVRTSSLLSSGSALGADVLDGFVNLLPYGISEAVQKASSCMADGYKTAELACDGSTAVYSLTSAFTDTPEPREVLLAAMFCGIADFNFDVYFNENTLNEFAKRKLKPPAKRQLGERCCYLMSFSVDFSAQNKQDWTIFGDTGVSHSRIAKTALQFTKDELFDDIEKSSERLLRITSMSDGLQLTGDKESCIHHLSCVTYNNMRGGIPANGSKLDGGDLLSFIKKKNVNIFSKNTELINRLASLDEIAELKSEALKCGSSELLRLCLEYIPVSFSRRHGDPSRPWNKFSIVLSDESGRPVTYYEGNWRDIFQNWEAMCMSFPELFENAVVKFLNSSTADGFNPLKINKFGFEFETPEGTDEWGSFGYSGDHQLIYLIKLTEHFADFYPDGPKRLFENDIFTYADTPYELSDFDAMLLNPKRTIRFDAAKNKRTLQNAAALGEDGRYILDGGMPYTVSFAEKLAVPALCKISNLIPGGGIWMNTQKAEWNDANNALVGIGMSIVTVCNLRRYLVSLIGLFKKYAPEEIMISEEVYNWLESVISVLEKHLPAENTSADGKARYRFLSEAERCFDTYRHAVYGGMSFKKAACKTERIIRFFELALIYAEDTIRKNKRHDMMYHSYNVMALGSDSIEIKHQALMLEGQTAVLDCGLLCGSEAAALLCAMEKSGLYSERDKSFYLYPPRITPPFTERNILPKACIEKSKLAAALLSYGNHDIITRDCTGKIRFAPQICCIGDLNKKLDYLQSDSRFSELISAERETMTGYFEDVFRHGSFLGRSQIMYKYEGIGCIYWHQNSKLRVAALETLIRSFRNNEPDKISGELKKHYGNICGGLCYNKSAEEWGAFPTDSYSHTPYTGGASQPVMTGQVKEDIIARIAELGILISDGRIEFHPELTGSREPLKNDCNFKYIAADGTPETLKLQSGSYAFTFCRVPVVCEAAAQNLIEVTYCSGIKKTFVGLCIPHDISRKIFSGSGEINKIHIGYIRE